MIKQLLKRPLQSDLLQEARNIRWRRKFSNLITLAIVIMLLIWIIFIARFAFGVSEGDFEEPEQMTEQLAEEEPHEHDEHFHPFSTGAYMLYAAAVTASGTIVVAVIKYRKKKQKCPEGSGH